MKHHHQIITAQRVLPKENCHFHKDRPHRSFPTKLLRQNAFYLRKMEVLPLLKKFL